MIKVEVVKANANIYFGKNATFLEGEYYLCRKSKKGNSLVMKSEEGYWIPVIRYDWAKSGLGRFIAQFTIMGCFFLNNYDELKGRGVYY